MIKEVTQVTPNWQKNCADVENKEFEEFRKGLNDLISILPTGNPGEAAYESILQEISGHIENFGDFLFRNLGEDIRVQVKGKSKEGDRIHFLTDDSLACIPWELVYDRKQEVFWGEIYQISRTARPDDGEVDDRLPCCDGGPHRIANIAGPRLVVDNNGKPFKQQEEYFSELTRRLELITSLFNKGTGIEKPIRGNLTEPNKGRYFSVFELGAEIADCDLVHMTCHGQRENNKFYFVLGEKPSGDRTIIDEMYHLDRNTIMARSFKFRPNSLCFINACSSASGALALNEYKNMGWAVYQKNAGIFAGTVATIPTDDAVRFAEEFLKQLIIKKQTAGQAMLCTKQYFRKKDPSRPFCLLYCLYGNLNWTWEPTNIKES